MKLSISEIKTACDIYDCDMDDFERVLMIESVVYPKLLKIQEQNRPKPKKR